MENITKMNYCNHYKEPFQKHKKAYISSVNLIESKLVCTKCHSELNDDEYDHLIKVLHKKNC